MTSVPLRRVAAINPPSPQFEAAGTDDVVTFMPLETVWSNGRADVSRRAIKADVATGYTRFDAGDILVPKVTPTFEAGRSCRPRIATSAGAASTEVHVVRGMDVDADFLTYVFQSLPFLTEGATTLEGVGNLRRVPADWLAGFPIWRPSDGAQREVVSFLDRETAEIDALMAKQEALVAVLREHRRSSIAQALEAVLDPSSGARLKHFVTEMRQGWSPQCESAPADGVTEWGVLKTGCVNGGVFRPEENKLLPADVEPRVETVVRRGEVVMSRASTRDLVGSAAVVEAEYPRLMLSDKTYAITVDPRVADPWFVSTLLATPRIRQAIELEATGASHSMQNVSKEDLLNLPMPLPPVGSQIAVARALKDDAHKVDAMVDKAEQLRAKLKERRAALITAAVTGSLDVTTYGKAG